MTTSPHSAQGVVKLGRAMMSGSSMCGLLALLLAPPVQTVIFYPAQSLSLITRYLGRGLGRPNIILGARSDDLQFSNSASHSTIGGSGARMNATNERLRKRNDRCGCGALATAAFNSYPRINAISA